MVARVMRRGDVESYGRSRAAVSGETCGGGGWRNRQGWSLGKPPGLRKTAGAGLMESASMGDGAGGGGSWGAGRV
jgi:hypothetical protein